MVLKTDSGGSKDPHRSSVRVFFLQAAKKHSGQGHFFLASSCRTTGWPVDFMVVAGGKTRDLRGI